jgi:hypothetical protein
MMNRDQKWFEFPDERSRQMDRDAWIVLRASRTEEGNGIGRLKPGYEEQYFGAATALVPMKNRAIAERNVNWNQLDVGRDHAPWVEKRTYHRADEFHNWRSGRNKPMISASGARRG